MRERVAYSHDYRGFRTIGAHTNTQANIHDDGCCSNTIAYALSYTH